MIPRKTADEILNILINKLGYEGVDLCDLSNHIMTIHRQFYLPCHFTLIQSVHDLSALLLSGSNEPHMNI